MIEFDEIVHSHPQILSGELVFVGTRVPARTLLDYIAAGDSLDAFLEDFPGVSREQAVQLFEQVQAGKLSIPEARPPSDRQH
jgi:uncharacterized protein (DUF433 family)